MSDRPGSVSEHDAATFEAVRPRLFGIAYRIVGGAAEAEDVVQDTWIRWHGPTGAESGMPARSSRRPPRASRSTSSTPRGHATRPPVAPGCPTRSTSPPIPRPVSSKTKRSSWPCAALVEKLSATERAVFVLREGFDYPYRQIGDLLELSEANARQLLVRARARLAGERHAPGERQRASTPAGRARHRLAHR